MKRLELKNRRILYIGPVSFFYDKMVIEKLIKLGAEVEIFNPFFDSLYYKLLKKSKSHSALLSYKKSYFEKLLSKSGFDYILVRHISELNNTHYSALRNKNPNAIFINFHWDALRDDYNYLPTIASFDKVFSFDYKDCDQHKEINYLPLFFIDEYAEFENNDNTNKEYTILFIGAWRNLERYNLIKKTKKFCKDHDLKFFYYLQLPYKEQYNSIKKGILPKESKNKILSHKEILKLFSKTKTIIDFPSAFQTGLTMRTFETLAAGKKLITTNKNIIKEPFYDPENIQVIDADHFQLDLNFLKSSPTFDVRNKMENYSIENYIFKLLNEHD